MGNKASGVIKRWPLLLGLAAALAALLALAGPAGAQEQPLFPTLYRGAVAIGGKPAPDGAKITARVLDYVTANPAETSGGQYAGLTVSPPPDSKYKRQRVSFFADGVLAAETATFSGELPSGTQTAFTTQDLNFPTLPLTGERAPTPLWLWAAAAAGAALVAGGLVAWRPHPLSPSPRPPS